MPADTTMMPPEITPAEVDFPQINLRFVKREGRFILQQMWTKASCYGATVIPISSEWRDVPLVEE